MRTRIKVCCISSVEAVTDALARVTAQSERRYTELAEALTQIAADAEIRSEGPTPSDGGISRTNIEEIREDLPHIRDELAALPATREDIKEIVASVAQQNIEMDVKINKNDQSTLILTRSPVKPIKELMAIINKEVAIAFLIGNLANKTKTGIIKKPPPAPTNPVIKPIKRA